MQSQEFVSAYPRDLPDHKIYQGNYSDAIKKDIQDGQAFSYEIGKFTHDILSDTEPTAFVDPAERSAYKQWARNFRTLEGRILADHTDGVKAWTELNFHNLNSHMIDLWTPLHQQGWSSDEERRRSISIAQKSLALNGLLKYYTREKLKEFYQGTEAFFTPEAQESHGRLTGILQEIDAAIILIDIMRKNPNLTVLPAPMQFEHSNPHTNADFLVVDFVAKRALGVQVKSQVSRADVAKYDPERVVLVDGVADLDNVKVVRIKKGSSKEAPKPWPGIISAKQVDTITTTGKNAHAPAEFNRRLLTEKILAKQLVGHLRVDYRGITERVHKRILDKL